MAIRGAAGTALAGAVPIQCARPGRCRAALVVPRGRLTTYTFVVDGRAAYDPDCPTTVDGGQGGWCGSTCATGGGCGGEGGAGPDGWGTAALPVSRGRRVLPRVSGLDLYSEWAVSQVVSMLLFWVCSVGMIPHGALQ